MKKLLAVLLSALLLLPLLQLPAYAAAGTLTVSSPDACLGKAVSVQIELENNPGFSYLKIAFSYNTEALTLTSVENGTVSTDAFTPTEKSILWDSDTDSTANGTLVTFHFTAKETVGEFPVTVRVVECYNDQEQSAALSVTNGTVNVLPDHDWNAGEVTTPATCTAPGEKTFTCAVCGGTKTEAVEPSGHSWGTWTKLDDTNHQRVCANDASHVETEAHAWNAGEVTTPATCTAPGVKTFTCAVCDGTKTEAVAPSGHAWGAWTKADDNNHQRVCANDPGHKETAAHTWDDGKVTTAATEAAEGAKTFTCTVCGATKTEPIPKTEPAFMPGDVDGNGKIETKDARLALRCSIGLEKYETDSREYKAADVTKDGKVGTDDARFILRKSVGLTDPEIAWA